MTRSASLSPLRRTLLLVLTTAIALVASIALHQPSAHAAYNILDYKLTPSSLQAGGHPNFHYHVDPDAANADKSGGDDLKRVVMDFPSGLLGNPEAATTKCSTVKFNADDCPAASYIGSMKIVVRFPSGSTMNMTGTVHVLSDTSAGSAATIGFIVKPSNTLYRKILLTTEATGVVSVRSGTEADYGLTMEVDNIPRVLTTIFGSTASVTVADISVDINGRAGKPTKNSNGTYTPKGPYFVFNPTRCTAAPSRATITSYANVENVRTGSFTPSGCTAVPFAPTVSYAVSNPTAGQSTGIAATFGVPTADAPIQNSHVRNIQTDLPAGTRLDLPAIGNVPALCEEADLNADQCPVGSRIGSVSASVPFLPPTMTGEVYMLSRGAAVEFGYILRGGIANSVKAPLKGQVTTVDANNDGIADFVRATAFDMPQAPWSTSTIDFSTPLVKNPNVCPATPAPIATKITGWSGAVVNKSNAYPAITCPPVETNPPIVSISSPVDGAVVTAPSVNVVYTVNGASTIPSGTACTVNGASSTSTSTNSVGLALGANNITVICLNAAGSHTQVVTVNRGDLVIAITSPANNTNTSASLVNVVYTINGSTTIPAGMSCLVNGAVSTSGAPNNVPLALGANVITVSCANAYGSYTRSITVNRGNPPVVVITSPLAGSSSGSSSINVAYTVDGASTIPAGTICTVNGQMSTNPSTNSVALTNGANTIVVSCNNAFGVGTASMVLFTVPPPNVWITSPANGTNATATSINVAYTVNGSTSIPAGTTCVVNGSGSTSATTNSVNLAMGANTISVVCTNSFGVGAPSTITVNRGIAPAVTIASPISPSTSTVSPVNVSYVATGSTPMTCTVNGVASTSPTANSVSLVAGSNTITVTCTNAFGSDTKTVTVTGVAPTVAITAPANNTNTTSSSINVAYTVNGSTSIPAGTTCTVNGAASSNPATNSVSLSLGANTISVTCTNVFGSSVPATSAVNYNHPPGIAISSPANNSNSTVSPINVTYTVNGASTIPAGTTCTINGTPTTTPNTNSRTLVAGANTITLTCANVFGAQSASITVNGVVPIVAITSPSGGTPNVPGTPINVAYTVNGAPTIPAGTTCTINGAASTSATTNSITIPSGGNSITVVCTNAMGSSTPAVLILISVPAPSVAITSPANGSLITQTSTNVSYTVNGGASIPAGTSCSVNGAPSASATTNTVALAIGPNSITVACTNSFGTGSAAVAVTRLHVDEAVYITSFAPPSAPSTATPAISFAGGTAHECRVNSEAFAPCSSPWALPLSGASIVQGSNTYDVRATSGVAFSTPARGHIWVDDRPFSAAVSVTPQANTLVDTAGEANDAGAHPDISATVEIQGYDDPQTATVKFPDGLMGSLSAIPSAQRCSAAQAGSGSCPASSRVGSITGTAMSPTDGLITANGEVYMVDAAGLDAAYAAGAAVEFDSISGPVTGDLGDVVSVGGIKLTDQGRNVTVEVNDIPRTTSTGKPLHVTAMTMEVEGDAGPDDAKPLVTNPHFCNDALEDFSARPNFQQFVGAATGYNGSVTAEDITADYVVDNCAALPFSPTVSMSLTNPTAGSSTGLDATVTMPEGSSTLRGATVKLPPFVSLNFPSFGVSADMCNGSDAGDGSASDVSPPGTFPQYYSFDASTCPSQAKIGTATIETPLIEGEITGNVYLIDKSAVPWIGIDINPSIPGNPQGIKLGLVGFNQTVNEIPGCTTSCQQVVQSTFTSVPDVPVTSLALHLGGVADRISIDGPVLNPNILNVASANSNTCKNSGTVATAEFNPWSGGAVSVSTPALSISGCNDPKINITSPVVPTTGARIVNTSASTINFAYTLNGTSTIPVGTTCTVNGFASTNPATNTVNLAVGVNNVDVVCNDAFGTGTATRRVDRGIPSVAIRTPLNNSTTTSPTTSVTLGVHNAGAAVSTLPAGVSCSISVNGGTPIAQAANLATATSVPLQSGPNVLVATCTNATGTGTSQAILVNYTGAPGVVIGSPANGAQLTTSPINVAYSVGGSSTIPAGTTCTVNGAPSTTPPTNSVSLVAGANTITVACTNSFGTSTAVATVTGVPPTVAITAPLSSSTSANVNVSYTVNGLPSIPAGTTCTVNGMPSTSAVSNPLTLVSNPRQITVACTNVFGTGSDSLTLPSVPPPAVTISSPANGSTAATSPVNVAYLVDGSTTIPAGTTCTFNGTPSTSTTTNSFALIAGVNTATVACTNAFGSGSASVSVVFTSPVPVPQTTITSFAPPSAASSAAVAVAFTSDIGASYECRINSQSFAPCSSAWPLPLTDLAVVEGENGYQVRAINATGPDPSPATGYIWVDDRPFSATATVAPLANDITTDPGAANDAGAHPDITATLNVEGNDDPQTVNVKFPDGLMGSLRAIPLADRCLVADANSGDCPESAKIGIISGTAESPTDGLVTAQGSLYLIDAAGLDTSYAAGVAAEFDTITGPVTGDLGDIVAKGGLKLTDQARTITTEINDLPRVTSTGKPFHVTGVSLTVEGDAGPDNAKPLITNPHFCNDAGEEFTARPNFQKFVGTGTGYNGEVTGEITADYVVDNCAAVPFNPTLSMSLTDSTAGSSTGLDATISLPDDHSTLRAVQVKLPPFVSLNFPSFGVSADMCSGSDDGSGSANNVSEPGATPAYYTFDASNCPSQAQIGTATITTPLIDGELSARVYLIDKSPVPWLGIDVNPNIPGNPQGVSIGLVGFNATVNENPSCTSNCQQVVQSTFSSVPDVPVSSMSLHLGGIADRTSVDGPALNPNILNIASANSNTCKNSGAVATAEFVPWSGTASEMRTPSLNATGCNDPKISITAPATPVTGAKIVNTSASTINFAYTLNGASTIPVGTTCTVDGVPSTSTATNAVSLDVGVNNIDVVCTDLFGTGTASRRVDRGVPSVSINAPTNNSVTSVGTAAVALGVSNAGNAITSLPAGLTCNVSNNGGTPIAQATSLATATTVPLVAGTNLLVATCTNATGVGTSSTTSVTYQAPQVTTFSPPPSFTTTATSISLQYRVNGGTTLPVGTTCNINGVASTSAISNTKSLVVGANVFIVTCSNAVGSTSGTWTITRV